MSTEIDGMARNVNPKVATSAPSSARMCEEEEDVAHLCSP